MAAVHLEHTLWAQKKKNQVSAASMTSASDEEIANFQFFFSRIGLRIYQRPCISVGYIEIFGGWGWGGAIK